jgi:hypothetical protein
MTIQIYKHTKQCLLSTKDQIKKKNKDWVREVIPFFSLLPIPFCASPKPGTGFPSTNVVVFFFHNHLKRDVVVCFVDISGCGV